jgi:hypothetical protein
MKMVLIGDTSIVPDKVESIYPTTEIERNETGKLSVIVMDSGATFRVDMERDQVVRRLWAE